MAQFGKISQWFLQRDLHKKLSVLKRDKEFFNLEKAKSFGVVFDATDEKDYHRVASFVRHLQSRNKNVKALGYLDYKETPHYIMQQLTFDFILKKDLNFFLKPKSKFFNDFLKRDFDVLIDFNLKENPVLHYCSALSKAKFKIGKYSAENENVFDFMIEGIGEDETARYAKEVLNFLETLETK